MENENLKNDLKLLKSYARKISNVNKLYLKFIERIFQWIKPSRIIDSENVTEEIVDEWLHDIDWIKNNYDENTNCIKKLQEEIEEMKNALTHERETVLHLTQQIDDHVFLMNQIRDEISSSPSGWYLRFLFFIYHRSSRR